MKKSHRSRYINRFGGIFLDFHANVWYNKKAALAGFLTSLDGFFITYHDTNTTFNPIYFRLYQISTKRKRAENRRFCRISYTFGGGGEACSDIITYLQPFKMGKVRNCVIFLIFLLNRFNLVTKLIR